MGSIDERFNQRNIKAGEAMEAQEQQVTPSYEEQKKQEYIQQHSEYQQQEIKPPVEPPAESQQFKKKPSRQKEFVSSYGNKFVFQRMLPSAWLRVIDQMRDDKSATTLYSEVLDKVVVFPSNLQVDDFEKEERFGGFDELAEVVAEAQTFQLGNQRVSDKS